MVTDDLQLIESCLAGERKAQFELVRSYGPRLLTVCRRFVPARLDPQDVLQDAFISIFTHLEQFNREKGLLWPWLKTIVIREALKKHRLTQRWHLNGSHIEDHHDLSVSHDEFNQMDIEHLMGMISALPDGYREVFNLVAIEGYSHDECAGMLGIACGTSRSCLSRARQILQQQLQKQKAYPL